jgi:fimbrial chaperone protein
MRTRLLNLAALTCLVLTAPLAYAGSFMVDPTRIELTPDQLSATLVVRNDDQESAAIRVEVKSWQQKDGEDVFEPTQEILVTPPIVNVPSGTEQILRIALRRPLDPNKELTYRIFLQEIPPPPRPGFRGLQVALRISLPAFALPATGVKSKSDWKLAYDAKQHALRVALANTGNDHLQVQEFTLAAPGSEKVLAVRQTSQYVLAGQSLNWLINLDPSVKLAGKRLRLKAVTDAGHVDKEIDLDMP